MKKLMALFSLILFCSCVTTYERKTQKLELGMLINDAIKIMGKRYEKLIIDDYVVLKYLKPSYAYEQINYNNFLYIIFNKEDKKLIASVNNLKDFRPIDINMDLKVKTEN